MIEKKLHFVWVGDETRRPENCIESWRRLNPGYAVQVWGNADMENTRWANQRHLSAMLDAKRFHGVADIMRLEIIYHHGGIVLDADSICVRGLEDWLLEPDAFAVWENEWARPGLIAMGALGSVRRNPFFAFAIGELKKKQTVVDGPPWYTTGPMFITACARARPNALTVYPSHFFYPEHFTGLSYQGKGAVFARQLWGTSRKLYGTAEVS